jgi:hypothetical protein
MGENSPNLVTLLADTPASEWFNKKSSHDRKTTLFCFYLTKIR